jgi:glycosyltransferase involved in cell wall biosynthesis
MKRILLMDSGSYLVPIGGSINAMHQLYTCLKGVNGYKVDVFGDLSKINADVRAVKKDDVFRNDYDLIIANSIRDVLIVDSYLRKHKRTKVVYVDRANILVNQRKAGAKVLLPKMIARRDLLNRMKRWLTAYVAITPEQEEHAASFFQNGVGIHYIPIAPNKEFRKLGTMKTSSGAVYVGRLDERQKRLNFLIIAISKYVHDNAIKEGEVVLKIIGGGPDEKKYRHLVHALGMDDHIEFMGLLTGEKLVKEYNNAGFCVSTSAWESPGRSFIEAMACGLPLLVNDRNNAMLFSKNGTHVVSDGKNGLVYHYGDVGDFIRRFDSLYRNGKLRAKMSNEAHKFSKRFTLKAVNAEYKSMVRGLIG